MKKNNLLKLIIILIILIFIILIFLINSTDKQTDDLDEEVVDEKVIAEDEEYFEVKQKYECNEFKYSTLTAEGLLNIYLNDYKNNIINNPTEAYNSLDKEYREKRFGTIEEYRKYINENIDKFKELRLSKYEINKYDNYDEYICLDQYNNFYIFNVTAVMKYTLKLDTYTVDSEEYIKEYNAASTQEKVLMNIKKVFAAIEDKGYRYVYSKLDSTFKENNYKTLEDFSEYIKKNVYIKNKVTLKDFTNEGNTYIYNLTISDNDNNKKQKDMTMIIQLREPNDFVMSFSFQ